MTLADYIVTEEISIIMAIKKIDMNASGNIFVCKDGILLAVVTDGDIRRSIMKNVDMQTSISKIANYKPFFLNVKESRKANELMKSKSITALPIVDDKKYIIDIKFLLSTSILAGNKINIPLVIMAGGQGTRLKPYTDILPKPLIPIGDKTITEHIINRFDHYGCQSVYMIVNYKKNFIKSYFADNADEKRIAFIEEEEYLGTGGGLFYLKDILKETFFLTNCDVLIEADYGKILRQHKEKNNIITIVCAKKEVIVPYGTVQINLEGYVTHFTEKPRFDFYTSTGLYIIEPCFLEKIEKKEYLLITDIIKECISQGEKVGTYLVEEDDWMDMGQLEELEKMKNKMGL